MKLKSHKLIIFSSLFLTLSLGALASQSLEHHRVVDGDTIVFFQNSGEIRIRLLYIDAPELKQPFGRRSKEILAGVLKGCDLGGQLYGQDRKFDRYGRMLMDLECGEETVSNQMVKAGAAWVYRSYRFPEALGLLEEQARLERTGLWEAAEAIPPWSWRRGIRSLNRETPQGGIDCAVEKACYEITSCEEARYRLRNCGQLQLDRDLDGLPCEAICR